MSQNSLDVTESEPTATGPEQAKPDRAANALAIIRNILETVILTAVIFLAVQSVGKTYRVEGHSMDPTLHDGQFIMVNKAVYWALDSNLAPQITAGIGVHSGNQTFLFHPALRGDIIVFKFPQDTTRDFVKRVIGLPGETVSIANGYVYVNGKPLSENYIEAPPQYNLAAERVPPDNYFVLGDNRNNSSDSHVWGMVPFDDVIGQAWLSYWPLADWGIVSANATAYTGQPG